MTEVKARMSRAGSRRFEDLVVVEKSEARPRDAVSRNSPTWNSNASGSVAGFGSSRCYL